MRHLRGSRVPGCFVLVGGARVRTLATSGIVLLLVLALATPRADARWTRISRTSTNSSPYYVCPRQTNRVHCALVQDPTRGTSRRGPLAAGAITKGPEQEVSPAVLGTGVEGGYSPEDLRSAYALPSGAGGSGQTVAVVDAYDDPNAQADLNVYRAEYGIPECSETNGCFRKVDQAGGTKYPAPNGQWAKEISLDLDMVSAVCPNCHILLVEASSNLDTDLAAAEEEAAKLGATEMSNSFVGAETPEDASSYDHPGIPTAAAGGDSGFAVESPASYPGVIAVGGTSLHPAGGRRGWNESVWGQASGEGTGSGCSHEPKPAWQTDAGCLNRTTNDVSAVADPNTPVSAYDSYPPMTGWMLIGGTSASTPIVSATMALTSVYTRSFAGAAALYLQAATGNGGFNDITSGLDGSCGTYLCEAGPGYDGPSGLGSLHGPPEVPPPTPVTGAASSIAQSSATLGATVNSHGAQVHECEFEYGTTIAYGSSVPCSSLPSPSTSPVPVSAPIAGLTAATIYHFRIAVGYPGGPGLGADATFTTTGPAPTVSTGEATAVTQFSVRLNGQVNPNGSTVGECEFEYGPTTAYGQAAACTPAPGGGQAPVAVSAALGGFAAGSTLHYRVVASNASGTSHSGNATVTLLPPLPVVITRAPSAITQTSATLNASVDTGGAALTACAFEFNSSEASVPCDSNPAAREGPVAVSGAVKGLTPGTTFRYRILASNRSGTSYGEIEEFASLAPPPVPITPVGHNGSKAGPHAVLSDRTLLVRSDGGLSVTVRCPGANPHCRGSVRLQTLGALSALGRPSAKRVLTLATASFAAAHRSVVTVRMRLSAAARGLLAHAGHLRARAIVVTGVVTGSPPRWQTIVTLRPAAARRPVAG